MSVKPEQLLRMNLWKEVAVAATMKVGYKDEVAWWADKVLEDFDKRFPLNADPVERGQQ